MADLSLSWILLQELKFQSNKASSLIQVTIIGLFSQEQSQTNDHWWSVSMYDIQKKVGDATGQTSWNLSRPDEASFSWWLLFSYQSYTQLLEWIAISSEHNVKAFAVSCRRTFLSCWLKPFKQSLMFEQTCIYSHESVSGPQFVLAIINASNSKIYPSHNLARTCKVLTWKICAAFVQTLSVCTLACKTDCSIAQWYWSFDNNSNLWEKKIKKKTLRRRTVDSSHKF